MSGALEGVAVLDFSQSVGEPYAATMLTDSGADVVSVEPPSGTGQRRMVEEAVRPNVMRDRRSVVLDLKSEGANEVVADLVEMTDVVVHNYRPDAAKRLGIDYDSLVAAPPATLSVTAPGVEHPPPRTGEQIREVLRERGFDEAAIRSLLDRNVVAGEE